MTALVRVYLCTYRRPTLLKRALGSLIQQSMRNWVCEVHNDDPTDAAPGELVRELGDSRVEIVNHPTNFGATRTLSIPFASTVSERYVSLLEDDNWWQPEFLQQMTDVMESRPDGNIAWSDMTLWREEPDGRWTDTGRTVWAEKATGDLVEFDWPPPDAWRSATHSHGAMLIRSSSARRYVVPESFPVAAIEHVRERAFDFPILLVNRPLANFAITRDTARGRSKCEWGRLQTLLASSFFANDPRDRDCQPVWNEARKSRPPGTNVLMNAALRDRRCRRLLSQARFADILRWLKSAVRHPLDAISIVFGDKSSPLEEFLDRQTRARFDASSKSGDERSRQSPVVEAAFAQ